MSNKQKAKIMSESAFMDAVRPMLEQAVAEGYAEGFKAGYEKGSEDAAAGTKLVLPK